MFIVKNGQPAGVLSLRAALCVRRYGSWTTLLTAYRWVTVVPLRLDTGLSSNSSRSGGPLYSNSLSADVV